MRIPICNPDIPGSSRIHFWPLVMLLVLLIAASCRGHVRPDSGDSKNAVQGAGSPTADAGAPAGADRLRIMSYNVLKYGDDCQGPAETLNGYFRTIVRYAAPDIIGLVKVAAKAPAGFANAVRDNVMNSAFPARYGVCPFTNKAEGNNVNLLFYNQQKLGYAGMQTILSEETDFNLYKLYLKSSVNAANHDTAFLYILLNHTASGDESAGRDAQLEKIVQALHKVFRSLPDVIDMGDFNLRNTSEPGYAALVSGDAAFRFSDPPFAPDHTLKYPADWEQDPEPYARFLTTSTRKNEDEPNDCGTGGGAKFWFDHILLSPSITAGTHAFSYVPKSFRVIGNDGGRTGRSVNAGKHPNTSVPENVADALFEFSNKYPVMLELEVRR